MLNHRIRLITIAFLAVLGLVLLAGSVASAQGPAPTTAASTATATFTPTKAVTNTVAVTATATTVPPTATKVPPTATLVPSTATKVPPTATLVPPTATKVPPTATLVPPTATKVPPTATKAPPTLAAKGNVRANSRFAFSSYGTGFQVQNLSGIDSLITINYYNQDGSQPGTGGSVSDTVLANSYKTYATIAPNAPFNGSVVISSQQPIAAIVNIQANNFFAIGSYNGSSSGNTTVYIPLLMKNNYGQNTWFNVQSAGGDTTVTATYSDGAPPVSLLVKANSSTTFNQLAETHLGSVFSAVLTTSPSTPIVVTVIEEDPNTLLTYGGFSGGAVNPAMPLINENNYGIVTGVQIQNASITTDSTITVSYRPSQAGTACTETQTIPHGQSKTFSQGAFTYGLPAGATSNCVLGQKFIGSAQVTTNTGGVPLMAIVNQLLISGGQTLMGDSYRSFDPAAATQTVVFPLIMDRNYGLWTGFSVLNVGSATTLDCTFTPATAYSVHLTSAQFGSGQAYTDQEVNKLGDHYVGTGTCTAGAGGKIIGIVNETLSGSTSDGMSTYEGFNK